MKSHLKHATDFIFRLVVDLDVQYLVAVSLVWRLHEMSMGGES